MDACYAETGTDVPLDDTFCNQYDGLKGDAAQSAADLMNCYADAFDGVDCTDADAVSAVYVSLGTECVQEF